MSPLYARSAAFQLRKALLGYPVVAVTGSRQAGKSTFLKTELPDWQIVSLEDLDTRELALRDPRAFLNRFKAPLIIDEAQRAPELFSYIQTIVDHQDLMGRYVLSGSQQFSLLAGITQSLAGRVSMIEMHPLRLKEMVDHGDRPNTVDELILNGGYPAVHARHLEPQRYYSDYVSTYLERDVRSLSAVQDLGNFQRFMRLCATRTGQLLNLNSLATDCGIAQPTANAWLNLLEASFIVKRVAPYYRNFGKRLVKAPKLYFLDTGLCAWLMGITSEVQLQTHYARGALFETWVLNEALKWRAARGETQPIYFWRDNIGNEVDLLIEQGGSFTLVEVKSGETYQSDWTRNLQTVQRHIGEPTRSALVYGGDMTAERSDFFQIGWRDLVLAG
jgi:uncharacterized protein